MREDGWQLAGLFDVEPAMICAPEYEYMAAGLFLSGTSTALSRPALPRRALPRRILLSYGYSPDALIPELVRRLLAWTLLHRYGKFAVYLRHRPHSPEPPLSP